MIVISYSPIFSEGITPLKCQDFERKLTRIIWIFWMVISLKFIGKDLILLFSTKLGKYQVYQNYSKEKKMAIFPKRFCILLKPRALFSFKQKEVTLTYGIAEYLFDGYIYRYCDLSTNNSKKLWKWKGRNLKKKVRKLASI